MGRYGLASEQLIDHEIQRFARHRRLIFEDELAPSWRQDRAADEPGHAQTGIARVKLLRGFYRPPDTVCQEIASCERSDST